MGQSSTTGNYEIITYDANSGDLKTLTVVNKDIVLPVQISSVWSQTDYRIYGSTGDEITIIANCWRNNVFKKYSFTFHGREGKL